MDAPKWMDGYTKKIFLEAMKNNSIFKEILMKAK
jgi:hypothetical protein